MARVRETRARELYYFSNRESKLWFVTPPKKKKNIRKNKIKMKKQISSECVRHDDKITAIRSRGNNSTFRMERRSLYLVEMKQGYCSLLIHELMSLKGLAKLFMYEWKRTALITSAFDAAQFVRNPCNINLFFLYLFCRPLQPTEKF